MQLVSKAQLEGFYYKPRVDHGLLKAYGKGIIALSGCLKGEISEAILDGNESKALEIIKMYQEIFGADNFFLEVQDHPLIPDQIIVNQTLFRLAKTHSFPLVATNDNHYCRKKIMIYTIFYCAFKPGKRLMIKTACTIPMIFRLSIRTR